MVDEIIILILQHRPRSPKGHQTIPLVISLLPFVLAHGLLWNGKPSLGHSKPMMPVTKHCYDIRKLFPDLRSATPTARLPGYEIVCARTSQSVYVVRDFRFEKSIHSQAYINPNQLSFGNSNPPSIIIAKANTYSARLSATTSQRSLKRIILTNPSRK